jgi:hypothetical protein
MTVRSGAPAVNEALKTRINTIATRHAIATRLAVALGKAADQIREGKQDDATNKRKQEWINQFRPSFALCFGQAEQCMTIEGLFRVASRKQSLYCI